MNFSSSIELLFKALANRKLSIIKKEGKKITLEDHYVIEIENDQLFKLLHEGQVVAPFDDIDELCQFIQMDRQLNAKS